MTAQPSTGAPATALAPDRQVFGPHRAGLPPLATYGRYLWRRRAFAVELSKSSMHAAHTDTVIGQAWLILNPLLLAVVYYLLVDLIGTNPDRHGGTYFAHLLGGLFAFYFVSAALTAGGSSVVGGGKLIMNQSFPRLLLPLSAVRTAFLRFVPTLPVYFAVHLAAGLPIGPGLLLVIPALALLTVFATGMACLFATLQVYFRDVSKLLPYLTRIWLYLSPVLLTADRIHAEFAHRGIGWAAYVNPLYALIGVWGQVIGTSERPTATMWTAATVWALGTFTLAVLVFISREREFAVRL